jgi:PAS domain S-box-containing protein
MTVSGFDGYIKHANRAAQELVGRTEAELQALSFVNVIHPDDREEVAQLLEKLVDQESPVSFEAKTVAKDGSTRDVLWSAMAFAKDQVIYAAGMDISAHKEGEEARLELAQNTLRRKQALFLHDDIVQGLVAAKLALDLKDDALLERYLDETLSRAKSLVRDLVDEVGMETMLDDKAFVRDDGSRS